MIDLNALSKEISYALRHAPWEYELEMDDHGRVPVAQLLSALHRAPRWQAVVEADLVAMLESSEKKRFEIGDGTIRAFYGHSIPMKIVKEQQQPPDVLYHGTARRFADAILEKGLLPQSRQYVHLSQDVETAEVVGRRHDSHPQILVIDALLAWRDGVKFYYGNEKVWLADRVPSAYISVR